MPKLLERCTLIIYKIKFENKNIFFKKKDILIYKYLLYIFILKMFTIFSNSFFHGTQSLGTFDLTRKNSLSNYRFVRFEMNRWQHWMATPVFRQPEQTLEHWEHDPMSLPIHLFIYNLKPVAPGSIFI